jgi:hypothetical protein
MKRRVALTESSADAAARFIRSFTSPTRRVASFDVRCTDDDAWKDRRYDDTTCLRAVIVGKLGRHPKTAVELFAEVRDDFGSCDERRLWRQLAWLVEHGQVERVGERNRSAGYRIHQAARRAA